MPHVEAAHNVHFKQMAKTSFSSYFWITLEHVLNLWPETLLRPIPNGKDESLLLHLAAFFKKFTGICWLLTSIFTSHP